MAAENEADKRSRQQRTIQALINEKRAELDRYFDISTYKTIFHRLFSIIIN